MGEWWMRRCPVSGIRCPGREAASRARRRPPDTGHLTPRMLLQDLRYALRSFARNPGLVAAAVICLALGIGANATIFGVVDTLLFRPPPHVTDPDRVVRLYVRATRPPFGTFTTSTTGYPLYTEIRDATHEFESVAAFARAQRASLGRGPDA